MSNGKTALGSALVIGGAAIVAGGLSAPALAWLRGKFSGYTAPLGLAVGGVALAAWTKRPTLMGAGLALAAVGGYGVVSTYEAMNTTAGHLTGQARGGVGRPPVRVQPPRTPTTPVPKLPLGQTAPVTTTRTPTTPQRQLPTVAPAPVTPVPRQSMQRTPTNTSYDPTAQVSPTAMAPKPPDHHLLTPCDVYQYPDKLSSDPSLTSPPLLTLPANQAVSVLGTVTNSSGIMMAQIRWGSQIGWVRASCIGP